MELVLLNSELITCIAYFRVKSQVKSEASDLLQYVWPSGFLVTTDILIPEL